MVVIPDKKFKEEALENIAREMCLAARTAPKARGIDLIMTAIVKGETIGKLADRMKEIGESKNIHFFSRDAEGVRQSKIVVLIGTKLESTWVKNCDFCGYDGCAEKEKTAAVCAFNTGDLGIAIGSALSIAMDHRVDNRLMFSIGKAAIDLSLLPKDIKIVYGIPLSATGKNPFFDRK